MAAAVLRAHSQYHVCTRCTQRRCRDVRSESEQPKTVSLRPLQLLAGAVSEQFSSVIVNECFTINIQILNKTHFWSFPFDMSCFALIYI